MTTVACSSYLEQQIQFFITCYEVLGRLCSLLAPCPSFLPLITLVQSSKVCLWLLLVPPYQVLSFLHRYILHSTNNYSRQNKKAFSYSGKDLISSSVNCPFNVFLIKAHLPFSLRMSSNLLMGIFCFRLVPKFWKRKELLLSCVCLTWHAVLETSRGSKLVTAGWTMT